MTASDEYRPSTEKLPAVYFLYVIGSGGHTGEMCQMIKHKFRGQKNLHRRYILTSGDRHSWNAICRLEAIIEDAYIDGNGGTWDAFRVPRARHVHQRWYTAWITTILSSLHVVNALTREPNARPESTFGDSFRYPHVIVTNGPGTGFIVCVVAHLLKIFRLVPENRLKMVYVESWARSESLSLTGKLFYYTDIADLYVMQHEPIAKKYGKPCVGLVSKRTTPVGMQYPA